MNYLHSFLLTLCLKSLLSNANEEGWAYPKISWMENKSPGIVHQKILFKTSQSNNIVYRIIHDDSFSDIFELTTSKNKDGQNEGTLTIKKRLDREEKDEYKLQIGAFDQSTEQQLKFTTVTISIMDQNDNKPEITNPVGQVYSVLEKVQDAIVTRINVRDLDEGENAAIDFQSPTNLIEHRRDGTQFRIPDNEVISYFRIDSNGDLRTSGHGTLDAEKVEKYTMDIQVCDNAQMINGKRTCQVPSNQSNKYKMTVEIKDRNDNAPVFKSSNYQFTVSELADTDTDVGEIEVADDDIDPANQHTKFYFNEYNDIFKISTDSSGTTGKIRIKQKGKLDYETKKTYRFTVNAKNTDPDMSRVSQTTVQINIKDENEPPIFEKSSYELEVEEGEVNQRGFESILVKAEDRDQIGTADQQRVTYSIKPGSNTVNWFEINQTTGELRVNMPVDREARPYPNAETNPRNGRYPVTVTACDNYRPQACADQVVYVNVKDKNDNHPTFWKDGSFKTSIRVTACQNVRSVYNQDSKGWFKIDNALVTIIDKDNDLNASPFRLTIDNSEMGKHFKLEKNNRFQPAAGMNAEQFYLMTKLTELAKPDSGHVYQVPVVLKDRHDLATPEKSHQIEISSCRCTQGTPSCDFAGSSVAGNNSVLLVLLILLITMALLVFVVVFYVYHKRRNRMKHPQYPEAPLGMDTIAKVKYDGGAGCEDIDIDNQPLIPHTPKMIPSQQPPEDIDNFIRNAKQQADNDPSAPPYDSLLTFDYEGRGSTAGSLSSLCSATTDETVNYDYIREWGPQFEKLAEIYTYDDDN